MDKQAIALDRACFWPCVLAVFGFVVFVLGTAGALIFYSADTPWYLAASGGVAGILSFVPLARANARVDAYREERERQFREIGPDWS